MPDSCAMGNGYVAPTMPDSCAMGNGYVAPTGLCGIVVFIMPSYFVRWVMDV